VVLLARMLNSPRASVKRPDLWQLAGEGVTEPPNADIVTSAAALLA
jgi:hypothetical protein